MRLSELVQIASTLLCRNSSRAEKDPLVVIPLSRPNIGGSACVPVSNVANGFDWDDGKFFICPQNPVDLLQIKPNESYEEIGKKRLAELHEDYKKLSFDYGYGKGRAKGDWIDGFCAAMKMKFDDKGML